MEKISENGNGWIHKFGEYYINYLVYSNSILIVVMLANNPSFAEIEYNISQNIYNGDTVDNAMQTTIENDINYLLTL